MLGDDPEPGRGNILYIYGIDEKLKLNDVLARLRPLDSKCRFFFLKEGKRIMEEEGQEGFAIFLTTLSAQFAMEKLAQQQPLINKFKVQEFEFYRQRRQFATLRTKNQKQAFIQRVKQQYQQQQQNSQQQQSKQKQQQQYLLREDSEEILPEEFEQFLEQTNKGEFQSEEEEEENDDKNYEQQQSQQELDKKQQQSSLEDDSDSNLNSNQQSQNQTKYLQRPGWPYRDACSMQ
eukprot:TRINITY_DN25181_c0_g1_i2.p1 TRINITY_DN25181_c0_g1~~TRINITY_DN25181_c0_g1_i2.p1  ORF type:complete len:268 (-),score=63.58 TRINITY_DN25181_c0_g1_i2:45-743(-)